MSTITSPGISRDRTRFPAVVSPTRGFGPSDLKDGSSEKKWLNRIHYSWISTEIALPSSGQPDLTSFRGEWPVLLECASPAFDPQRLVELKRSADWSQLLVLAEEHGVLGHLAKCLRELDENLVPENVTARRFFPR